MNAPTPAQGTVLVVDDDEGLARLMTKSLGREGFTTLHVGSGAAAIASLAGQPVDLMLLDMKLPDMAGINVVSELEKRKRNVPFIVITGQGDERLAVEMMRSGALDYLVKDAQFLELLPAVVSRAFAHLDQQKRLEAAEQQLRKQHAFSASVFDASGAIMFIADAEGRLVQWNRTCEKTTGWSSGEIRGKRYWELFQPAGEADPDANENRALFADAGPGDYEVSLLTGSGERRLITWSITQLQNEQNELEFIIASGLDITERKRADQTLRDSEQRLSHALEATREGVWDWNIKTGAVFFSAQWCRLLGFEPSEVPPRVEFFFDLLHPDDVPTVQREIDEHVAGRKPIKETEIRLRLKSGEFCWFLDHGKIVARDANGEPTRMVGKIIDITERKHSEAEASRQQRELAHLSRVTILGELSGSIAHELNQPLAAMLSNAQVGRRSLNGDSPDLVEMAAIFDDITDDAKRAGGIIHGMRAMFKKDASMEAHPVDVNEAVNQAATLLHSEVVVRKVSVNFQLSESLPLVMAGRVGLQQVLVNLILNSLDALKSNNGTPIIEIATKMQDDHVVLTVRDNGPGIPSEFQSRLFEPFASTKAGGLGLGLAISRSIVESFGGELLGENREGGALFSIVLPVNAGGRPCAKTGSMKLKV